MRVKVTALSLHRWYNRRKTKYPPIFLQINWIWNIYYVIMKMPLHRAVFARVEAQKATFRSLHGCIASILDHFLILSAAQKKKAAPERKEKFMMFASFHSILLSCQLPPPDKNEKGWKRKSSPCQSHWWWSFPLIFFSFEVITSKMNTEIRSALSVVIEKGKREIKNRLFVLSSSISTLFVSCGLKHNRLGQVWLLLPLSRNTFA